MKHIALDTNIAIGILNEEPHIIDFLQVYDRIFLPVTVVGELLYGAKNSSRREANLAAFRGFIEDCTELQINTFIAEIYSDIRLSLKEKGTPIPENDIWIAAICMGNDIPLLTRDGHFEHVEGLVLATL